MANFKNRGYYTVSLAFRNSGRNTNEIFIDSDRVIIRVCAENWQDCRDKVLKQYPDAYNISPASHTNELTKFSTINNN